MSRFVSIVLLLCLFLTCGYRRPDKFVIDAVTNASRHNLNGINYLQEHCYYAAIQEFKIAIQLSPNTQATAIFKNNLGEVYNFIGYPDMARICFEDAIKLYGLNFKYYINLIETYKEPPPK